MRPFHVALLLLAAAGCDRSKSTDPEPTSTPSAKSAAAATSAAPAANATGAPVRGKPVPTDPLRADRVFLEFGVYVKGATSDIGSVARERAGQVLGDVQLVEKPTKTTRLPWVHVETPPVASYKPPDLRTFGLGLSPEEAAATATADGVVVLMAATSGAEAVPVHRRMLALADQVAQALDGTIWDAETRQVFSRSRWHEDRLSWVDDPPDVEKHITMHAYPKGGYTRIVSLGLRKFGYPDLVVNDVEPQTSRAMGHLMNLAEQQLVERGHLDAPSTIELSIDDLRSPAARADQERNVHPGAKRHVRVAAAFVTPEAGDADNRLIELLFTTRPGQDAQAAQRRALEELYGAHEEVVQVDPSDPALRAASKKARAELMKLKSRFEKGPRKGERLSIKSPFETRSGGTEWLWADVIAWDGPMISAKLENEPYDVPQFHAGSTVRILDSAVFDYIHHRADGTQIGNETAAVIRDLSKNKHAK